MILIAGLLWLVGLVTLVPYGIWYLLFYAQRDEYAFWITAVLFWIFGYWGVVGPLLAAWKVRRIMKLLESCQTTQQKLAVLDSPDTEDVAVDLIASENHVPKFIARRVYRLMGRKLQQVPPTKSTESTPDTPPQ